MAGTNRNFDRIEEGPAVILVEPQLGENIGMVARAMANFGLIDLRLVAPRDGWPNEKAEATASGAGYVLERVRVFDTLADSLSDLTYVVATTARQRDGFKRVLGPAEASATMRARTEAGQATGILFGRERFGLDNAEISLADDIVTFPVNPAYASLNIAQAVLLMAYEFLKTRGDETEVLPFAGPDFAPAPREELVGLFDQLEAALDSRGYFRPPERKPAQTENLRAVLSRPGFSVEEIRLLRGVISSLDRFSPARPRGDGSPQDDARRQPAKFRDDEASGNG
jgi:tRNA/rRNA methyltransferase